MSNISRDSLTTLVNEIMSGAFNDQQVIPISTLCEITDSIIPVLRNDETLVNVSGKITVVGDIHGQLKDLIRALSAGGFNEDSKYVFLGDYVDRGKNSLEVITLLYAIKLLYPENIVLLRGNHECEELTEFGGFLDECETKANREIWERFCKTFDYLPLAAIINSSVFCVHGGLSPSLQTVEQIKKISRPTKIPEKGLIADMLWSDPDPRMKNFGKSIRGDTCTWGQLAAKKFFSENDLNAIVRGHQVAKNGYSFPLIDENVVTLFSAEKKCGILSNKSAIMIVREDSSYEFEELNENTQTISEI